MTDTHPVFKGLAIVVSVSENISVSAPDLGLSVQRDGDSVAETLQNIDVCGYSSDRVVRIAGRRATLANIKLAFADAALQLGPDDPFLFFYSGHGGVMGDVVLVPYDADNNSGFLTSTNLAQLVAAVPSRRKLIVIDACHSGGLTLATPIAKSNKALTGTILDEMATGEGVVVIASSRSTESSYIHSGDTLSLFTKYFIRALEGAAGHDKDGFVRVFDLFNFVAESVRLSEPNQAPVYASYHQDTNFPVAYCASEGMRKHKLQMPSNGQNSVLLNVVCDLYPLGPTDQDIWIRAGGDISRLNLEGSGRVAWTRAIRDVERGASITVTHIVNAAAEDYPFNSRLKALLNL